MEYNTIGLIGRFRPLHIGAAALLDGCFSRSEYVHIGIGSANVYDDRNPFTANEVENMIQLYLKEKNIPKERYTVLKINDHFGKKTVEGKSAWVEEVKEKTGN